MAYGRAYFLDNSRADVVKVVNQLKAEGHHDIAFDLLQRYDTGTLNEGGGNTYRFEALPPSRNKDGSIKKGSGKIKAIRNDIRDLPVDIQIDNAIANIDGVDRILGSLHLSDQQLLDKLTPHNKKSIHYREMVDIINDSLDPKSGIQRGPGQVGSPVRQKGDKPFPKPEAVPNAAQFLTEPDEDRLLGGRVVYSAQGHVFDRVEHPEHARNIKYMRRQQYGANHRDGAGEAKLKNLTREEVLRKGRLEYVEQLEDMVNDYFQANPQVYNENLLNQIMASKYGLDRKYVERMALEDPRLRAVLNKSAGEISTADEGKAVNIFADEVHLGKAINGNGRNGQR
mgnify:CR=1 FL=1